MNNEQSTTACMYSASVYYLNINHCYTYILADIYTEQFGKGTGPILLDNVECTGNESSLSQCLHNEIGHHNCIHFQDIGVQCFTGICN